MSFGDPNNPYGPPPGQQPGDQSGSQPGPPSGYGYPRQAPQGVPQQGYGYPQQPGNPPGYGYPQQPGDQPGYGYPPAPPAGTLQANSGYITIPTLGMVEIATMGRRLGARAIDGAVISVVYSILFAIGIVGASNAVKDCGPYSTVSAAYDQCMQDNLTASTGIVAGFFTGFLIFLLITLLYEWLMISLIGATLGKLALGLRVVKESTGQAPGLGAGFVRWIMPSVGALLCGIGAILVYLSPFFDNTGKLQGWHDRAAATLVVKPAK